MAVTNIKYGGGGGAATASNGTTAVTLYTFSASLKMPDGASGPGGIIDKIRVFNADTIAHIVELHLVPSGGSAGNDTLLERITLQSKEPYNYVGGDRAAASAFIQIKLGEAISTLQCYARVDVSEIY